MLSNGPQKMLEHSTWVLIIQFGYVFVASVKTDQLICVPFKVQFNERHLKKSELGRWFQGLEHILYVIWYGSLGLVLSLQGPEHHQKWPPSLELGEASDHCQIWPKRKKEKEVKYISNAKRGVEDWQAEPSEPKDCSSRKDWGNSYASLKQHIINFVTGIKS